MPIYPDVAPPVERTGCGDAYTSIRWCLDQGYSLEGALQLAPITPASVVLYPGAQQGLRRRANSKNGLKSPGRLQGREDEIMGTDHTPNTR